MTAEIASSCPCCGAYSGTVLARPPALLAVCDVLVIRALEAVGRRIVRLKRDRFSQMHGRPWHVAHTLWRPDEVMTAKALNGAWDVVPAMLDNHGCCGLTTNEVTKMLDEYVHELIMQQRPHDLVLLKSRFENQLHVQVMEPTPYSP
jgi:hypothetical protein